jgi:hypothetical protein
VAEAVKQRSPNTPVILLTGWGALMNKEERPDCINILLNKPPTMEKIRSALVELQLYEECENEQTNYND